MNLRGAAKMAERKGFVFLDVIATAAVLSVMSVALMSMSAWGISEYGRMLATNAAYREISNFANLAAYMDDAEGIIPGERNVLYYGGSEIGAGMQMRSKCAAVKTGGTIDYELSVECLMPSGRKGGGFNLKRSVTVRRMLP